MKVAGKMTPRIRRRIEELFDAGGSVRSIAKALSNEMTDPPARSTIGDVLKGRQRPADAPDAPLTRPGVTRMAPEPPSDDQDAPGDDPEDPNDDPDDEEPPRVRLPPLPKDASPAAWAIWSRLKAVGAKITSLESDVSAGNYPATQWAALIKVETTLARDLAEQIPPPPPDPAKDPTNIAARAMVHQQVVQMVQQAGEKYGRICVRCRKETAR